MFNKNFFGLSLVLMLVLAMPMASRAFDDDSEDNDSEREDCECPKEYEPHNGNCARVANETCKPNEAPQKAKDCGAELFTFDDISDFTFVQGLCAKNKPNATIAPAFDRITVGYMFERHPNGSIKSCKKTDGSPWTGFGCPCEEGFQPGTGIWYDGVSTQGQKEPKNNTVANCVQMIWNSDCPGRLAATPCDTDVVKGKYLIKFKSGRKIRKQNAKCRKAGYKHRRGKCYKVGSRDDFTYEQAVAACKAEGTNLTSIRSISHLTFLQGLCMDAFPKNKIRGKFLRIFIGLEVVQTAGKITSCKWKDGTKFGGVVNPMRKGFYKTDHPWCNKAGIDDGLDEPKDNATATWGFLVKNDVKCGCVALGPRKADEVFTGTYIGVEDAYCDEGMYNDEGECKNITTTEEPSTTTESTSESSDGSTSEPCDGTGPCATEEPCNGTGPCATETPEPCNGTGPCATETPEPCDGTGPCATETPEPCDGTGPCATEEPCNGTGPCATETPEPCNGTGPCETGSTPKPCDGTGPCATESTSEASTGSTSESSTDSTPESSTGSTDSTPESSTGSTSEASTDSTPAP